MTAPNIAAVAAAAAAAARLREVKEGGGKLHIFTGAGMSVMSGVPVFRHADGSMAPAFLAFLKDYNTARRKAGLDGATDWFGFSVPEMFRRETEVEAWAYWRWRALRARVEPAEDYHLLGKIADYFGRDKTFVTTSNCDQLHVLSGTSDKLIHEIHGSLGRMQCAAQCCETLHPADSTFIAKLKDEMAWIPRCPACSVACLRPNIMIFDDHKLVTTELDAQAEREAAFAGDGSDIVVLEIGGGTVVPSIRYMAEYAAVAGHGMIRINPSEAECTATERQHARSWLETEYFPVPLRSDAGLRAICQELGLLPADGLVIPADDKRPHSQQ